MEAAPPPLANARHQAKYSLQSLICARHQKILLKGKEYFAWLSLNEQAAGLASIFCSSAAESPPTPPFRRALARNDFNMLKYKRIRLDLWFLRMKIS